MKKTDKKLKLKRLPVKQLADVAGGTAGDEKNCESRVAVSCTSGTAAEQ